MDIPKDFLSKDFLRQFKTEEDVSNFLTDLHARVLEQIFDLQEVMLDFVKG